VCARDVDLNGTGVPMTLLVAWVGLVGTAGGVLLAVAAQRLLAPTSASLVLTLEVVAGAALAYVVLGEAATNLQVWGGLVMLAGVAVAQVATARHTRSGARAPHRRHDRCPSRASEHRHDGES
jgi:drug/metabolite transporter (DMT)-like permease